MAQGARSQNGPLELTLLTGAVFVRVSYEGETATDEFLDDLIHRALAGARLLTQ